MSMPDRPVENDHRACRTARHNLVVVVPSLVALRLVGNSRPVVRSRNEPRSPIVAPELIYHKDKADHRPPFTVALEVHMKCLRLRAGADSPRVHRTEPERPPDDTATRLQDGLMGV